MKIGAIDLGLRPIMLAPMEDVTDIAFRLMCKRFGADLVYTEFVSSDALVRHVNRTKAKLIVSDDEKQSVATIIKGNAFKERHVFTGAREGGWGWTNLAGSVPDADDTAGALVALHILLDGKYCPEAGSGIEWLLDLQNSDGGMPTFCKGWGKLPFDRSSADISAHAILALSLWLPSLNRDLQRRCEKCIMRLLRWMRRAQAADGSWSPLWFGDQDARDKRSPVYGTATAVEYLAASTLPLAIEIRNRGADYLLSTQNADGGWGGAKDLPSKTTLTARAAGALAATGHPDEKAFSFMYQRFKSGEMFLPEPIGLYFSMLWYSEELYNIIFALNSLRIFNPKSIK
jgi:squalene-hopene/tetraprenyl-beta-curcumene cyclase